MIESVPQWMTKYIQNEAIVYVLVILLIIISAFILSRILRIIIKRAIHSSSKKLKIDPTQFNFLLYAINLVISVSALILIFYSIPGLKALGLTLFASAGFITAILLFASQQALSNIISGIFIVASKPFRVNDIIKVGNFRVGRVEDITLRHTVIRDFENRRIIIPNAVINSETVVNSSIIEERICNFVEFGISYDSDIDRAISIIQSEAMKHPNALDNRNKDEIAKGIPPVIVRVIGFGDSSVNLRAHVWSNDHMTGHIMRMDLYKTVKEQFDNQGIEIPFPYRTLVFKDSLDTGKLKTKDR